MVLVRCGNPDCCCRDLPGQEAPTPELPICASHAAGSLALLAMCRGSLIVHADATIAPLF